MKKKTIAAAVLALTCAFACKSPHLSADRETRRVTIEEEATGILLAAEASVDHLEIADLQARLEVLDAQLEEIHKEQEEEEVAGWFNFATSFLPTLPQSAKDGLKGASVPFLASLLFPRPRKNYGKLIKAIGKGAVAANPLGSKVDGKSTGEQLAIAARGALAGLGWLHTNPPTEDKAPAETEQPS